LICSCANPPTKIVGTLLSMPLAVSQALVVSTQITKRLSNHGHVHWHVLDSSCSYFNLLNFFRILRTLDWTWTQVRGGVNGNASLILIKISCHCCCVKLFMLLPKQFSNKFINNAVELSFQSLLDLGGAGGALWGTMDKGIEEPQAIIILALETVPW
jgi:hypothetical protein